jgi:hypothetical protein
MCKKVLGGFLFIALCLLVTIVPSPAQQSKVRPTVWDVYPAMDRLQIQAFVDSALNGDTVYFHAGIYDWSGAPIYPSQANEGAIKIVDKSLTIKGEPGNLIEGPDSVGPGSDMTGTHAFQIVDLDTNNDVTFIGLNIRHFMRGVQASYQTGTPKVNELTVPNARNITIRNCTITDMARQAIAIADPAGNVSIEKNILSQAGNGCIWLTYRGPDFALWQPDKSTVEISGNTITDCPRFGLYAERTKNFRFENNSISVPTPSSGTWAINIWGAKKGTVISANSISNYLYGITCEGGAYSPPDNASAENIIIDKNKISCVAPTYMWCCGICLDYDLSSGHMVTRNEINLTNGVGIYSEANHCLYSQNKISGTGWFAIWLSGYDYSGGTGLHTYAHHEMFLGNDVSKFTPSEAHYYLDYGTHENLVVGSPKPPWTYKNLGVNNLIFGGTDITTAAVQTLSAVTAVRPKPSDEFREARKNIIF